MKHRIILGISMKQVSVLTNCPKRLFRGYYVTGSTEALKMQGQEEHVLLTQKIGENWEGKRQLVSI